MIFSLNICCLKENPAQNEVFFQFVDQAGDFSLPANSKVNKKGVIPESPSFSGLNSWIP